MDINEINASPLEAALNSISKMLDPGASGAEEMRQVLWDIRDEIDMALEAFRENINSAQIAEIERLRAEVGR